MAPTSAWSPQDCALRVLSESAADDWEEAVAVSDAPDEAEGLPLNGTSPGSPNMSVENIRTPGRTWSTRAARACSNESALSMRNRSQGKRNATWKDVVVSLRMGAECCNESKRCGRCEAKCTRVCRIGGDLGNAREELRILPGPVDRRSHVSPLLTDGRWWRHPSIGKR